MGLMKINADTVQELRRRIMLPLQARMASLQPDTKQPAGKQVLQQTRLDELNRCIEVVNAATKTLLNPTDPHYSLLRKGGDPKDAAEKLRAMEAVVAELEALVAQEDLSKNEQRNPSQVKNVEP